MIIFPQMYTSCSGFSIGKIDDVVTCCDLTILGDQEFSENCEHLIPNAVDEFSFIFCFCFKAWPQKHQQDHHFEAGLEGFLKHQQDHHLEGCCHCPFWESHPSLSQQVPQA